MDRPHNHRLRSGPLLALGSAFLFGASTPIAKLLLGVTDPLLLAGLYLGSGIGLAIATAVGRSLGVVRPKRRCAHAICPGWARSYCLAAFSARPCSCRASRSHLPRAPLLNLGGSRNSTSLGGKERTLGLFAKILDRAKLDFHLAGGGHGRIRAVEWSIGLRPGAAAGKSGRRRKRGDTPHRSHGADRNTQIAAGSFGCARTAT
jgi:hypothetical protein